MSNQTLLQRLEQLCNVDVDCVDTTTIASLSIKPHNQTSNQMIMGNALLAEENQQLFVDIVSKHSDQGWEAIFDRFSVAICKKNIDLISGRVLVQVSPRYVTNANAIVEQCRRFKVYFEEVGISTDRFAIKIPFTGAAALATVKLLEEGIQTLATAVFSLEQAIAASEAGCLLISPYYNEIAFYLDESLWPNVADPALEHPMSPRMIHILEAFAELYKETGREQPTMVVASHFNVTEIMGLAELGCEHITISAKNLKDLEATRDTLPPITKSKPTHPYSNLVIPERLKKASLHDPMASVDWNGVWASTSTDYLANDAQVLDEAISADPGLTKRIQDAIDFFLAAEATAKYTIEREIASVKVGSRLKQV